MAESKTLPQRGGKPALIGITVPKEEDLSEWYQQVILKSEMLSYSDVPGCYILAPGSYSIWEKIQSFIDTRIKEIGVKNCYFPLFISEANLQREKEHIEGFAAEVAWVTHGGEKKLEKRIAVRPTSETAMYDYYARKINSHRDLPLKLNQWNNVVRWEFKHALPFLRSREFLWQEGHTAFQTKAEAEAEVEYILNNVYTPCYEELLACPMVRGRKTVGEQFPGADYTYTIEGYIGAVGRGIQAATAHLLGQHFSKMFNIAFEDPNAKEGEKKEKLFAWQNSWGFTTRSIGVMIMTHSDNKGLVMPPRVAELQVIIVPVGVTAKTTEADRQKLYDGADDICKTLVKAGVRAETDMRENYSPPWKFNDWELKGVPVRIEFGPKDMANAAVMTCRRDTAKKATMPIADIATGIPELLETIQKEMFERAKADFASHRKVLPDWTDFVKSLNEKNLNLIPHCLGSECEDKIKVLSAATVPGQEVDIRAPSMGAKSLCIPFEQPEGLVEGTTKCANPECKELAKKWVMFGRSY